MSEIPATKFYGIPVKLFDHDTIDNVVGMVSNQPIDRDFHLEKYSDPEKEIGQICLLLGLPQTVSIDKISRIEHLDEEDDFIKRVRAIEYNPNSEYYMHGFLTGLTIAKQLGLQQFGTLPEINPSMFLRFMYNCAYSMDPDQPLSVYIKSQIADVKRSDMPKKLETSIDNPNESLLSRRDVDNLRKYTTVSNDINGVHLSHIADLIESMYDHFNKIDYNYVMHMKGNAYEELKINTKDYLNLGFYFGYWLILQNRLSSMEAAMELDHILPN